MAGLCFWEVRVVLSCKNVWAIAHFHHAGITRPKNKIFCVLNPCCCLVTSTVYSVPQYDATMGPENDETSTDEIRSESRPRLLDFPKNEKVFTQNVLFTQNVQSRASTLIWWARTSKCNVCTVGPMNHITLFAHYYALLRIKRTKE